MKNFKIDLNFGVKKTSIKIAKLLNKSGRIEIPENYRLETFPFYNGREASIALVIGTLLSKTNLTIVFGENRNSDHIFVDSFSKKSSINNNPVLPDFSDEDYQNRIYFKWNEETKVVSYIEHLILIYTTK